MTSTTGAGTPARVAIVGTGGIARAHAKALSSPDGAAELVAAVDVERDRAEAFAAETGIPVVATSLEEALASGRIDVVHVCTPPGSHAPIAAEALRAGVVPVVEKPPTSTLDELDGLIELSASTGVPGACVFQHRFGSAAIRLRELIASGILGRPLVAAAHTYWFRDDAYFGVPWRGNWEIEGGGPTMGHGIHQFDLLLSILGPWHDVTAVAERLARHTETEDVSAALVRFESGALATIVNSVLSPRETSTLRFDFERATVELEHVYGYRDANWTLTPAPGADDVLEAWTADRVDEPSGHRAQFAAIYAALAAGDEPPVSFRDARDTEELIAALYASAFEGRRVDRGELAAGDEYSRRMGGDHPERALGASAAVHS